MQYDCDRKSWSLKWLPINMPALTKYTSQYMDNMSFDEGLGVNMVEIIGADGNLKNPATEETLQKIAGENYDTTSVDLSDPSNIIVTYLLNSVLVATETITKSGSTFTITKS